MGYFVDARVGQAGQVQGQADRQAEVRVRHRRANQVLVRLHFEPGKLAGPVAEVLATTS